MTNDVTGLLMALYSEVNELRKSVTTKQLEAHPLYKEYLGYTEVLDPNVDDMQATLSALRKLNAGRKFLSKLK